MSDISATVRAPHFMRRHVPWPFVAFIIIVFLGLFSLATAYYRREVSHQYTILLSDRDASPSTFTYGAWPALAHAEFFSEVRDQFITTKASFIEADLSSLILKVYIDGEVQKEVKILTKGREGSWWETPAGLYKVETKRENHFSSFGKVYLPWSLPFQGNFFIHGWPYYPNGEPVSSAYSGGCIRLGTDDAKAVYELARPGMPVLVFEKDFESDRFAYARRGPELSAHAYLAADLKSNFVLAEKGSKEILPIASLTKLVTAVVATEYVNIEREITIDNEMIVTTSLPRLNSGQKFSLYSLLHPLLLESSNEAAAAIARFLGRARFVELMNEKARAVGMVHTTLRDTSGSDGGNVSTAEDLFNLAKYLYNNRGFILRISSGTLNQNVYGAPQFSNLQNFNVFAGDPDFIGGKTGKSTPAGETLLSLFELSISGERRPVVLIILGSKDYTADARAFLEWVKTIYGTAS